jgi:mycothiol synthase
MTTRIDPFGGELGWVAVDPDHRRKGLSTAVCASVTARLIHAGYQDIYLYTEDFRLAALALYLKLGYPPFIHAPDMLDRWRHVCEALGWMFTPDESPSVETKT